VGCFITSIYRGTTLCIPTIFISYTGEALDYKAPLLKALNAVDKAAVDVCQYFDKDVTKVYANLGWEQEYFLIDEALYQARPDLALTGVPLWDIHRLKISSWKTTILLRFRSV
jgi:glutamine synthetase type III